MTWLRQPQDAGPQHKCDLPNLGEMELGNRTLALQMVWMCSDCLRVYQVRDNETLFGPMFEWTRARSSVERRWRAKRADSGIVTPDTSLSRRSKMDITEWTLVVLIIIALLILIGFFFHR